MQQKKGPRRPSGAGKDRVPVVATASHPAGAGAWRYALIAVALLLVALSVRYLGDADLGYHLRGGQWILSHRRFPSTDTYTYTRTSAPYVDLHWLYQLLVYSTYRAAGYTALSILNIALIGAAFGITLKRLELASAPRWLSVLLLLVAVLACEVRFHMRPEIVTWILMSLMLWILERRVQGRLPDYLVLLPVIQLLWTNSEGLFAIGLGILGAYLISDLVHARVRDTRLWRYGAFAAATCLINPYFVRGTLLPFTYLATLGASNPFKQAIAEFQSPWAMAGRFTAPALGILVYQAYAIVLLALIVATLKTRKVHELLIAAALFALSATALRNIPLFMIATLPLAASCWMQMRWRRLSRLEARVAGPAGAWVVTVIVMGLVLRTLTSAEYISEGRQDRFGLGLDEETQPVRAGAFLVEHHLDGRILNLMNTGGWLDWVRPGQVFIDGRTEVMGEDLFVESQGWLRPGGLARAVAAYHPDILFFNPFNARQWVADLNAMGDWRLVHLDGAVCVYLRREYAPEIPALDDARFVADLGIANASPEAAIAILREPPPPRWQVAAESFYRPAVHPNGLQMMALYFQYRGNAKASEALFLACIRRSRGAYGDIFYNLGLMYYLSQQYEPARACMERVLRNDPDNLPARTLLGRLS